MSKKSENNIQDEEVKTEVCDMPQEASTFVSERIKQKPINKGKLFRRTSYIVIGAIVFGIIACITFLVLEPIISNMLYPEEIEKVSLPDVQDEVAPDELLTEKDAEEEMTEAARVAAEEAAQSAIENAQANSEAIAGVETFESMYEKLYDVASEAALSLVKVTGVSTDVDWFQETVENENSITGIMIADNGVELLIVADATHLDDADSYNVTFSDETIAEAEVKSVDTNTGLGIFAVKYNDIEKETREKLVYATLGSSVRSDVVGRPVIAIGSPMGDYGSISYGTINSAGKTIMLADATYNIVSSDIFGSAQASGALINTKGEFIGIITKSSMETGNSQLVTAISISDIKKLIEKLSNDEAFAYGGIHGMDVTTTAHAELGVPFGAYVSEVDVQSPAMNAGISKGDVIVRVDDTAVNSFKDYQNAILSRVPGDVMWITVARYSGTEYREITCEVTTTERSN